MTIDERLEKLAERHESLTQAVELMAGMQRENEKQIEKLAGTVGQLVEMARQDGENIRALARISEMHERRLTDLEGGAQ